MLQLKGDILQELKDKGYNTNKLRKEKLLGEKTIQFLREGKVPGIASIDKICMLLNKQPGQIIKWIPDEQ